MPQRQAKCCQPSLRRGPAQPPACPAQQEEHRRELEALRAQLEGERLRSQEMQRRRAVERRELQEAAERERQLLADRLRSNWERQRASKLQRLREQSQRQREADIRQLLQMKEAQLRQTQERLQQRCNNANRQVRDLLRQLAKELLSGESSREAHRLQQEVQRQLCRKPCAEQAAHVLRLQRELQEQRRRFLHYILEHGQGQPPASCNGARAAAAGPRTRQRPACRRAVAEAGVQAAEQQQACPPEHRELREQSAHLLRALKDLQRQCSLLGEENCLLRSRSSQQMREEVERLKDKTHTLSLLTKQLRETVRQLKEASSTSRGAPEKAEEANQLQGQHLEKESGKKLEPHGNPEQEWLEKSGGWLMASCSLHSRRRSPALIRRFIARHSYNPFEGPNEDPENELPLTAGQYLYIFGDVDEDGWFLGELTDGTRGLVPSNLVEEVSDDDLDTTVPPQLRDLLLDTDDDEQLGSRSGGRK